jgi:NAD(P)-dependent dehydrogenase (short-subunit alcohol dehydrogenase family)
MAPPRKTAVVTGGNSGIGFETARALARLGWRVVVTGRSAERLAAARDAIRAETRAADIDFAVGDFASLEAVRALAHHLELEPRIDVLLNNAGIALATRRTTADGFDMMVQVNHLAPYLLTRLLLPRLVASAPARIVTVASRAHFGAKGFGFEDFQFERSYDLVEAYARTKLYNVLLSRELARRLVSTGVTANALHPGEIRTRIGLDGDFAGPLQLLVRFAHLFMRPQSEGAKVTTYVATAPELAGVTGAYFSTDLKAEQPSRLARSDSGARRLWEISAGLVGLPADEPSA